MLIVYIIMCELTVDGQFLPDYVQKIFERVRNNADFMPAWQMEVCTVSTVQSLHCSSIYSIVLLTFIYHAST